MGRCFYQDLGSRRPAAISGETRQACIRRLPFEDLRLELIAIAPRGYGDQLEVLELAAEDVERAPAD